MTDERHAIGANNPPRTVFDEIDDLHLEATAWLDGEAIQNDAQAEALGMLMNKIRAAITACDEERKEKTVPLDEAKAAIQAVYNPYIQKANKDGTEGKGPRALTVAAKVRDAWLTKKQAILDDQARVAREVAAEEKRIADEAVRASRGNLAAREQAEALLEAARAAEHKAIALAKAKPPTIGGRRTVTKKREAVLVDMSLAAGWAYKNHKFPMSEWLTTIANADVKAGVRAIPGFEIKEVEL